MLNSSDKIFGLVAQSMGGSKATRVELGQYVIPATYNFTAPRTGFYKFVLWGAGGSGNTQSPGAGSGAYLEYTRLMSAGDRAVISVPASAPPVNNGAACTVSFMSDGKIISAGGGTTYSGSTPGSGGIAVGGDVNIAGSSGGAIGAYGQTGGGTAGGAGGGPFSTSAGGGGGAPANTPYIGSPGVTARNGIFVNTPGPGAGGSGGYNAGLAQNASNAGGPGACFVQYLGAS